MKGHSRFVFVVVVVGVVVVSGERAYPLGCSQQPPAYYDYKNTNRQQYPFPPLGVAVKTRSDYLLVRRLGTGKFSDVFEAVDAELERQLLTKPTTDDSEERKKNINGNNNYDGDGRELLDTRSLVVVKCLKPVSERKIRREVLVLQHASQLPNLARLLAVVMPQPSPSTGNRKKKRQPQEPEAPKAMPSLVLQHAGPQSQWLCHPILSGSNRASSSKEFLTDYEIRYYLCHLLVALDALHSQGIMHRDVKPRNILINRSFTRTKTSSSSTTNTSPQARKKQSADSASVDAGQLPLMLIDLGLADFYLPSQKYNVRVASRHYKSPELLTGFEYYDYALDMWGVGCILAGLLLRREPFFRGKDNFDQLGKIVACLGTTDLMAYVTKYQIKLSEDQEEVIRRNHALPSARHKTPTWLVFRSTGCPVPSREGLDLLDKLLVYDHDVRLTAAQAMQHAFFDPVRRRVQAEVRAYHTSSTTAANHSQQQHNTVHTPPQRRRRRNRQHSTNTNTRG